MNLFKSMTTAAIWLLASSLSGAQDGVWPRVILRGDYPDPTILRDGEDYYMTHSSFFYAPGFLIWHSRDLLHWAPVARATTKVVGDAMAPDLVKFRGKFYIYYPAAGKNWVTWATNIQGPWSEPIPLNIGRIDPGHAVGEDGKRYLFLSGGARVPLTDDGLAVSGRVEDVYDGWNYPKEWPTEGMYLESPKVFRRGEYFYLVSAEGGTAGPPTSHMVVAARSRSINGPWENSPYNPIVHTYHAQEPWWSKGHGTVIDDINGHWWIVYHAYENGFYSLGRQTLLEPIEWLPDGWFRAAKTAIPVTPSLPFRPASQGMDLSDEFTGKSLGLQWMSWRNLDLANIKLKDASLRLVAKGTTPADAQLLLVTATDHDYEVQAEVVVDGRVIGGLLLFYNEKAFVGLGSEGKKFTVYRGAAQTVEHPNPFGGHFFVRIANRSNLCDLQASGDGKTWQTLLAGVNVSQLHHNTHGGFLALRPGLMAVGTGAVKFKKFQYSAIRSAYYRPGR